MAIFKPKMASVEVEQVISHYQRDIEKICSKPDRALKYEDRLLHCLTKLHKLPVTVNHLQVTGVGKTVNSLRKLPGKKGVSEAAKALVAKWKAMVIEEDEEVERRQDDVEEKSILEAKKIKLIREHESREYSPENTYSNGIDYRPSTSNSVQNLNAYSPQSISQTTDSEANYSPSKKPHKPNGYSPGSPKVNGIEVYCYSPSKKQSSKHEEKRKSSKSDSRNEREESSSKRKMKESSSDKKSRKDSTSSLEKSSRKDSSISKHEKHNSSSSHSKSSGSSKSSSKDKRSSSSSSKTASSSSNNSSSSKEKSEEKNKEPKKERNEEGIDSMSGTSFAAALGPMIVKKGSSGSSPKKKSKSEYTETKPSSSKHASSSSRTSSHSQSSPPTPKEHVSSKQLLDDVAGPSHLAPLDLDVVSTLSVPTPNYRPMPQPPLSLVERKRNHADEEDALAKIMSNKNSRTKVYSGVKGGLTYVPSLYEICCRVLQQHIDALEYTGGIPYSLLKPVLDAATPAQLYQFEHFNPYMVGDTDHLWQFHVNKEFRGERREEMESWRDMYLRCVDEREERYKAVTANIQESIKKSVPVRQTKLAYVDVAKPPRNILRKQIKNGTSKPDAARLLGKMLPEAVPVKPPTKTIAPVKEIPASFRLKPKVAPLMQKTLKSIKSTHFRR